MQPLEALPTAVCQRVEGVFCDVDDTLTWHGRLVPAAFDALGRLNDAGIKVVPITGRPGGWVDQIARLWPVDGVVGENGGLWFYLLEGAMQRRFAQPETERRVHRAALKELKTAILAEVPGAAVASDQSYRDLDLAIDFCEDVPRLSDAEIDRIVAIFEAAGATCKVSSIHVNGWFGAFDKLSGCRAFVQERWSLDLETVKENWLYVGDSPNDEPMFRWFPHSVGVANVRELLSRMTAYPRYVTAGSGGHGFAELVDHVLRQRNEA
ncbi:MAG: HAD family hydrolase [Myxococcota bacterium]